MNTVYALILVVSLICIVGSLIAFIGELADREFRGVKIECHAFARDGGGGSAMIYRRFGAYPVRPAVTDKERAAMLLAFEALKAEEDVRAAKSAEFAKWWLDPQIPTKVKTFAMLAARILTLTERCPIWKPNYRRISDAAVWAGVQQSEIEPNGKYYPLLLRMMETMRAGAAEESVETACEAARKYD